MEYKAKTAYQDKAVVDSYDRRRFYGIKGRAIDFAEKSIVYILLKKCGIKGGAHLLDIPCGTGRLALYLARKGYKITGADISAAMTEKSTSRFREEAPSCGANFVLGNAESLSFADNGFDAVVCLRLLGHTPPEARTKMIAEFKRVSRKAVILIYYHKNSLQNILRRPYRRSKGITWNPVTITDIKNDLKAAGLKEIAIFPMIPLFSESIFVAAEKE